MLAFSPGGVLLTTETSDGRVVAFPDSKHTGHPQAVTVPDDLNQPHGLALHKGKLYVAETNQVRRYDWDESQLHAANGQGIARLPGGGGHFTRTLLFAKGKMYVSVGSSCNVCVEEDRRRATVLEFNDDFGWPYCYGNRVPDISQTKPGDQRCQGTIPPKVEIQAHSTPLGLAF